MMSKNDDSKEAKVGEDTIKKLGRLREQALGLDVVNQQIEQARRAMETTSDMMSLRLIDEASRRFEIDEAPSRIAIEKLQRDALNDAASLTHLPTLEGPARQATEELARLPASEFMAASAARSHLLFEDITRRPQLEDVAANLTSELRLIKEQALSQELTRSFFGAHEDFRRIAEVSSQALMNPEVNKFDQLMRDQENRFVLPERTAIESLAALANKTDIATLLGNYESQTQNLSRAMEAMHSPWLDVEDRARSVSGFAELQGIGQAIRDFSAFDGRLADALRSDLGDWRDTINWPPAIFSDSLARTEFYKERGLNSSLTDIPARAFDESLSLAGLRSNLPPVNEYESAVDDEEKGITRTNAAHDRLFRFEMHLRRFIDKSMTATFGSDWVKQRVPGEILMKWREKKQRDRDSVQEVDHPLIDYADFSDYAPIIMRADNWRDVFAPIFKRKESVNEAFQRIYPIRICTMHARIITQDDQLYLYVETKRLLTAIGIALPEKRSGARTLS